MAKEKRNRANDKETSESRPTPPLRQQEEKHHRTNDKNTPPPPLPPPLQQRVLEEETIKTNFWANFRLLGMLVMVLSSMLYFNTIPNKYAVDDAIVITRNQFTARGFAGMGGIWGEDTFVGFFGDNKNLVAGGRYRPFSVATFALENQLFGTTIVNKNSYDIGAKVKNKSGQLVDQIIKPNQPIPDVNGNHQYAGNPHVSHFVNVLLYGFLCVLLYWLFLELFNPQRDPSNAKANFIAFVAAMLYAAHPIHTEAVANIKGRDEILVLMGSLMALYWTLKAYNQRANKNRSARYIAFAVLGFLMGIFSKENAITFVAIIPVTLYIFTDARPSEIAMRTLPFVVISLLFWFGVRSIVFMDMNTLDVAKEYMNDPFMKVIKNADNTASYEYMDANEKYGFIVFTWLKYMQLLVLPHPLTNDYYPMHLTYHPDGEVVPSFTHPLTILSILIHLGLGALFIWGFLRRHAIAFCVMFYAATFSVVSNLFFAIGTTMAERFMFLPSVGFSLACAMGLWALGERLGNKLIVPLAVFGTVMTLYSVKTFVRNFDWKDDQVLFLADIEVSQNSAKLNNAVSGIYQEFLADTKTTDMQKRAEYIDKAIQHAERAIDMHPYYNQAWLLLGNAHVYQGDYIYNTAKGDTARLTQAIKTYLLSIEDFKTVLKLRYDHQDAIKNMWVSTLKLSTLFENSGANALAQKDTTNAVKYFAAAVGYYDKLMLFLTQDYQQLYGHMWQQGQSHPDIPANLGNCYRERGQLLGKRLNQLDASIESLEKAAAYLPNDSNIPRMLGVANGIKGNHAKAINYFEKALQVGGSNIAILYNLEVAYKVLIQQSAQQGVDVATIAQYEERQKFYHEQWYRLNPNYNPAME